MQTAIDEVDARAESEIAVQIIFDDIVIDELIIAESSVFDEENDANARYF